MNQYRSNLLTVSLAAAIFLLTTVSALADVERIYGRAVNADGDLVYSD
jgi:hypothetical protein